MDTEFYKLLQIELKKENDEITINIKQLLKAVEQITINESKEEKVNVTSIRKVIL